MGRVAFSLHTRAVESNIPVGEVLGEDKSVANDSVQMILVHLYSYTFDEVLTGRNNPFVHVICFGVFEEDSSFFLIKDKVLSSALLPARDILDAESVSVEPGEENVSDNVLDSLAGEFELFSPDDWTVTQVEPARISSVLFSNPGWVRIVLLRF